MSRRPRFGMAIVTQPSTEPVSVANAKSHARIETSDDDTLVKALIKSARRYVENYTEQALMTQTWNMWMDRFTHHGRGHHHHRHTEPWWDGQREGAISDLYHGHDREVEISKAPLLSVVSLSTFAEDDTETTFAATNYTVDTASRLGRIVLKAGRVWPSDLRQANAIKIQFTAGYGPSRSDVPDDLIQAIKMLVAHWYEHREAVCESKAAEVPLGVKKLIGPYNYIDI